MPKQSDPSRSPAPQSNEPQHQPTALIRVYGSDGRTSTLHPLRDILSRRTIATLAAIEEGGRQ